MICTYCKLLTHLHCTNTKLLTISDSKNVKEWACFSCASIELPFHKVRDELNTSVESDANYINEHLEKLGKLKKQSYLPPNYPISVIYIRRVSIHDKTNKL